VIRRCAGAALALVLLISGCSAVTGAEPVTVLGSWTGDEQTAFLRVLDGFTRETGIPTSYQGTRAQNQVLRGDLQQGTPPHVAILSNPAELAGYARSGQLKPLDADATAARAAFQPLAGRERGFVGSRVGAVPPRRDPRLIPTRRRSGGGPVDPRARSGVRR